MKLVLQEDELLAGRERRQSLSMDAVVAVALPCEGWRPELLVLTELIGMALLLRVIEAFFLKIWSEQMV